MADNNNQIIDSLDGISLEGIHNPQEPNTTPPINTGGDNQTSVPPVVPENPIITNKGDNDGTGEGDSANTSNTDNNSDASFSIKTFDDLLTIVTTKEAKDLTDAENEELVDIVDTFGGEAFSKDGAILNADGKVLYTAEQVKHYLTEGDLPINDNGDFVNADGEVVKTKSELFREQTTIGTVMNALAKNFAVSFNDNFLPADTEDSIVDVVNKVVSVVQESSVKEYMEANPELEAFRKHLILHGSAKGYTSSAVDYDTVIIKDLSKEAKQIYIAEAYKASGRTLTPAFSKYLDSLGEEDFNTEVAANLVVLKEQQQLRQDQVNSKLREKQVEEARNAEQYWNTVITTVKNGKLSNITIPLPERQAFLAYLTTPVENGKTRDVLDAEVENIDSDLLMSYLRYKGNDISALAKNIATTQQVQTLREKMNKNKRRNVSSDKGHKPTTQNDYIPNLGEVQF